MDLGLRHFAYRGYERASFSELRERGFKDALAAGGFEMSVWSPAVIPDARLRTPAGINPSMLTWLTRMPKPAGIFCANDGLACEILDLCRYGKLRVPEEICILGVDDDELLTQISHPPISSIALQTQKIGFEAAKLLDQLMGGKKPPGEPLLLPPERVVARQSTNLLAIGDEYVLTALRYIREHIHEQISVEDIVDVVPVNRRFLERRFREHLGRTPLQEIRRVRIETAKQLLSGTDLAMPAIARRSGFPNPERLANVFHAVTGMTPTHYRRQFRLHDS
jgi:LacI family transcriptional regulator